MTDETTTDSKSAKRRVKVPTDEPKPVSIPTPAPEPEDQTAAVAEVAMEEAAREAMLEQLKAELKAELMREILASQRAEPAVISRVEGERGGNIAPQRQSGVIHREREAAVPRSVEDMPIVSREGEVCKRIDF